jgi:hypothetical protein
MENQEVRNVCDGCEHDIADWMPACASCPKGVGCPWPDPKDVCVKKSHKVEGTYPKVESYRIGSVDEEFECEWCGSPVYQGEKAFQIREWDHCFCSLKCARDFRDAEPDSLERSR